MYKLYEFGYENNRTGSPHILIKCYVKLNVFQGELRSKLYYDLFAHDAFAPSYLPHAVARRAK